MKKSCLFALAVLLCGGAAAQGEATPPRFNGAVVKVYMARLSAMAERVALEKEIPADSLSPMVAMALKIDTAGRVVERRYLDRTSEGRDRQNLEPATAATRRVMDEAYARMEGAWRPAKLENGRPINYTLRMTVRIPVEKIQQKQDPDPLLFLGANPDPGFYEWARVRVRYDERFKNVGGLVHVQFYVEPDGKITIGKVLRSPDERLTKEVIRVIRNSKGKWTPRKVRGVPQRTAYEFRCNYINDNSDQ